MKSVTAKSLSKTGGTIEIRVDANDGPLVAEVDIANNPEWNEAKASLKESPAGVHDLFVSLKDEKNVEIDWIKFE